MHRRWVSLPLLTSYASAFYPYHEASVDIDLSGKSKRFIPYHQKFEDDQDELIKLDIKKVYKRDNKFPVVLSNNVDAPNALPVHQDGSDFSYFSTMKFGSKGQDMYMLIDTGSANTWVFSEDCKSKSCGLHNLFGKGDSTTLKATTNKWSLTYGTGQVSGVVGSDTVAFGNFSIDMGFGLATTASDDFLNYPMDGILGLGRATTNELNTPTVMEVLATQGKLQSKVVGIHLHRASDNSKDGEITFGGIDSTKFTGQITYTQASNAASWEIPVDDAFVNDTPVKFVNKKAIIDTGTSYVLMPPDDAKALHKLIPNSTPSGENFIIPCDTKVTIQVSFSGAKWSISPKDYVGKAAPSGNGCTSNIIGHQAFGSDEWILGDVFLKNVYAVFDFDQARIGFGTPGSGSATGSSSSSPTSTTAGPSHSSGMTTSTTAGSSGTAGASTTSGAAQPTQSSANIGNPFDMGAGQETKHSAAVQSLPPLSSLFMSLTLLFTFLLGLTI